MSNHLKEKTFEYHCLLTIQNTFLHRQRLMTKFVNRHFYNELSIKKNYAKYFMVNIIKLIFFHLSYFNHLY